MSNIRQAALQAILLCRWIDETPHQRGSINGMAAQVQHALEKALAEPEQEPVAWMQEMPVSGNEERSVRMTTVKMVADEWDNPIPLYLAPTLRNPLTEDQIVDIWAGVSMGYDDQINIIELARALERAHGIGEQT